MKRIGFYTILTLALFLPGYYLPVGNQALSLAINAVLFCIFLAVVYFKERREIRGL